MSLRGKITFGFFILSALSTISAITVKFQKPEYEVARGDKVDLRCTFQTSAPKPFTAIVTWTADHDDPAEPQISVATYFFPQDKKSINDEYVGKADLINDMAGGVSTLRFNSVSLNENRVFQCSVIIIGDTQGEPRDTTTLVVLVAPTEPVCNIQGAPEYGNNINLTCKSEEGSPTPTYKWARFDPQNNPQPFPLKTIEDKGLLSLFNLSMETSGYYVCTATNKIRSASHNLTLSVMPRSMNIGATAGIIGGAAAGLVVLLIIIYCCCCKSKKEEPEHEMEEAAAFHDKPRLESESGMSEATDRYRDTNEDDRRIYQDGRNDRYDDHSDRYEDRPRHDDRYDTNRSRSSDRLDRYDDARSHSSDRLDRNEDYRGRSRERLDRYDDNRGRPNDRYDDGRSRSSDRLERYDDSRSRSSDRLDRYEDDRDRHYDDRRDDYSDRR